MKTYLFRLLISFDQFFNVFLGPLLNTLCSTTNIKFGYPDETISSVLGKLHVAGEGNKLSEVAYRALNAVDLGHCEDSIEGDEGSKL